MICISRILIQMIHRTYALLHAVRCLINRVLIARDYSRMNRVCGLLGVHAVLTRYHFISSCLYTFNIARSNFRIWMIFPNRTRNSSNCHPKTFKVFV